MPVAQLKVPFGLARHAVGRISPTLAQAVERVRHAVLNPKAIRFSLSVESEPTITEALPIEAIDSSHAEIANGWHPSQYLKSAYATLLPVNKLTTFSSTKLSRTQNCDVRTEKSTIRICARTRFEATTSNPQPKDAQGLDCFNSLPNLSLKSARVGLRVFRESSYDERAIQSAFRFNPLA